jgi:hypothetical protein
LFKCLFIFEIELELIFILNRNSINELHQTFLTTIAGLETGEYEKTLTDEEWKV